MTTGSSTRRDTGAGLGAGGGLRCTTDEALGAGAAGTGLAAGVGTEAGTAAGAGTGSATCTGWGGVAGGLGSVLGCGTATLAGRRTGTGRIARGTASASRTAARSGVAREDTVAGSAAALLATRAPSPSIDAEVVAGLSTTVGTNSGGLANTVNLRDRRAPQP